MALVGASGHTLHPSDRPEAVGSLHQMNSIQGFMTGIVDYAGLYPPAKLDMVPMVAQYASFFSSPHADMLGRVIVPVSRLDEFEVAAAAHMQAVPAAEGAEVEPEPWPISALTRGANDIDGFQEDLQRIETFNDHHSLEGNPAAVIDAIELKASGGTEIDRALDALDDDLFVYFELDPTRDIRGELAAIVGLDAGAKIRTGGVTPGEHPSVEHVAAFINGCCDAHVPFKATAGLHHAIRQLAPDVGADTKQLGFINVFMAACLRFSGMIDAENVLEVLMEEDAAAFTFGPHLAAWRHATIGPEGLDDARWRFAHSFGSCSFDQPANELQALGLLNEEIG